MKIWNKEYQMMLTVKARRNLRALCPEKNLEKLDDFLTGTDSEENASQLILILSNGYEEYRAFWDAQEGKEYTPCPLTDEILENLSMAEHIELQKEALEALKRGFGITVKTEEAESKGKKRKGASEEQN